MLNARESVLTFIADFYRRKGRVPTIRQIIGHPGVKNSANFYRIFPEGLREACELAGAPVPQARISMVTHAVAMRHFVSSERSRKRNESSEETNLESEKADGAELRAFKQSVNALKARAKVDPTQTPAYVRKVLRVTRPELLLRLQLVAPEDNLDARIIAAVGSMPFLEVEKRAWLTHEKVNFDDWLSSHLADYLTGLIETRGCGEAEPHRVSSKCPACGGQLVVSASERTKIFCEGCKLAFDSCPVCAGTGQRFIGGTTMQCERCLFRLAFDSAPLPEVTLDLLCNSAALGIDSPRLSRYWVGYSDLRDEPVEWESYGSLRVRFDEMFRSDPCLNEQRLALHKKYGLPQMRWAG
jgi:hypothetical protein